MRTVVDSRLETRGAPLVLRFVRKIWVRRVSSRLFHRRTGHGVASRYFPLVALLSETIGKMNIGAGWLCRRKVSLLQSLHQGRLPLISRTNTISDGGHGTQ